jgi:hypothetical protein
VVGVLVFIPRASKLNHGIASTELIVSKNQTKAISVRLIESETQVREGSLYQIISLSGYHLGACRGILAQPEIPRIVQNASRPINCATNGVY